jgi:hypothetical protein
VLPLTVDPSDTVWRVKEQLQDAIAAAAASGCIPPPAAAATVVSVVARVPCPDQQRLFFAGEELQGGRTLGEYRVWNCATLLLTEAETAAWQAQAPDQPEGRGGGSGIRVRQIVDLGFSPEHARVGLARSSSIEGAVQWLVSSTPEQVDCAARLLVQQQQGGSGRDVDALFVRVSAEEKAANERVNAQQAADEAAVSAAAASATGLTVCPTCGYHNEPETVHCTICEKRLGRKLELELRAKAEDQQAGLKDKAPAAVSPGDMTVCPACTFQNFPQSAHCHVCHYALG